MNSCFDIMDFMKWIPLLAVMPFMLSCSCPDAECPREESDVRAMRVGADADGASGHETRSIIAVPGIEDIINEVSVAAYDQETGMLADAAYSNSCAYLMLAVDRMYDIYVVANMGNVTDDFPDSESEVSLMKCRLPSFGQLKFNGLPMAGMVSAAWKSSLAVEVRRLVAKVNITIDHSDMDSGGSDKSFRNTVVKVHRAARVLYPFRKNGSAAMDASDLYSGTADYQAITDGYAAMSETVTLYVPENMQGMLLDGNDDPWKKSESSEVLDASLCTYISLEGVKDGSEDGVGGDFIYRFFPGEDDTGNFDLRGNKVYDISMVLTWKGMYVADSWKVEKSNWSDSRRISVSVEKDHGYVSGLKLLLPQGAADVPVYVYYSPHGAEYESEEAGGAVHHSEKGWNFMLVHSSSGDFISTGFVEHQGYRSLHHITVSPDAPPGYTARIIYRTVEGMHSACLDIEVVEKNSPGLSSGDPEDVGDNCIEY